MRNGVVLLLLVLAAGGAAYLLFRDSGPADPGGGGAPTRADGGESGDAATGRSTDARATAGEPGRILGRVVRYGSGEPAAERPVRVTGGPAPIEAATDADGSFAVEAPSGVPLTLVVAAEPPAADVREAGIVLEPGEDRSLGTLFLAPAFTVRGVVVDQAGKGVSEAVVHAFRPARETGSGTFIDLITDVGRPRVPGGETTSGPDGSFELAGLSAGEWRFEANAPEYAVGSTSGIAVSPDSEQRRVRIVLGRGYPITGQVLGADGKPVENAAVSTIREGPEMEAMNFVSVQRRTDPEGNFRFESLAPGRISFMVTADGWPMQFIEGFEHVGPRRLDVVLGGTAAIGGQVTGPDGEAIEKAQVVLAVGDRGGGGFCDVRTDEKGRYRIERLPAGKVQFMYVTADGYAPLTMMEREEHETVAGKTTTLDVTLRRGATVRGQVLDRSTGRPVAGVRVAAMQMEGFGFDLGARSAVTGAEGDYALFGLAEGPQLLLLQADGFVEEAQATGRLDSLWGPARNDPATSDLPMVHVKPEDRELTKNLFVLPAPVVEGVVLAPDGSPVAGAVVGPGGAEAGMSAMISARMGGTPPTTLSGPDGRFRLHGAPPGGAVQILARAGGYVEGISEPRRIGPGERVTDMTIRLKAGGRIRGTVLGPDGRPLARARVRGAVSEEEEDWNLTWRLRQAEAVLTSEDGSFALERLAPGRYVVAVAAEECLERRSAPVLVEEGGSADVGVLALEAGLAISGVVRDERGRPVAGAQVLATPTETPLESIGPILMGNDVRTDAEGRFRVAELRPGDYKLHVSAEGFAAGEAAAVRAGTEGFDVVLKEGRSIEGVVLKPDGSPAAGAWVHARSESSRGVGDRTDARGRFRLADLADGAYVVEVEAQGDSRPARRTDVAAGTKDLLIRLEAGLAISGTVEGEDGSPAAGGWVSAHAVSGDGSPTGVQIGSDGSFRIGGLAPGEYEVSAYGDDEYGSAKGVAAGATNVRIVLRAPVAAPHVAPPPPPLPIEEPR